jgi:hypothetical protein
VDDRSVCDGFTNNISVFLAGVDAEPEVFKWVIGVDDGTELLTIAFNVIRLNDGVGIIEMLKEGKGSDICKAKVAIVEGSKVL